jgi:hypothetical protein
MATVRFVSLAGEEDVAPPFRTPTPTVSDQLVAHVEAHTGWAVRLCAGEKLLKRGDALPEDGVVVVAPTPHRTLAHVGALDPHDCVVVKRVIVDRHGCPLTFVVRNTRVTGVSQICIQCALTAMQWTQYHDLWRKCGKYHAYGPTVKARTAHFYHFREELPDGVEVGDDVDVVFDVYSGSGMHYGIVSICKV